MTQTLSLVISKRGAITQLIYTYLTQAFYAINLIRYRLQYPKVKFGIGIKIRGKFSIVGKGKVEIGENCAFISSDKNLPNKIVTQDSGAKISIGNNCTFYGTTLSVEGNGQIEIGNNCYFVIHSLIPNSIEVQEAGAKITIRDRCSFNGAKVIAKNCVELKKQCFVSDSLIVDTDYHSVEINRWDPNTQVKTKPICVGENVWLGSRSVILKGVSIGNNSVIGLGTIVRQSVPENVVVIGNPQIIIKKLDTNILPYKFPEDL
ncbi:MULTISPECIES: DapH/DapD/GlmU-related protein [Nostocales]|uniref:Transferase n=3 Tax=Nostocales TaxID=1161 RepID=A0A8S9TA94_9CYAN|nr:DapH/DapD/GlmU-related protein [Tolypothrix bouteillei]KAF3889471.1 hypothetical protein DA73_0400031305 [Tolypothrix bouteillei VB521301]